MDENGPAVVTLQVHTLKQNLNANEFLDKLTESAIEYNNAKLQKVQKLGVEYSILDNNLPETYSVRVLAVTKEKNSIHIFSLECPKTFKEETEQLQTISENIHIDVAAKE